MGAVLHVVVVVALAFLSVVECGNKDKTPNCKECNWELTIKTQGNLDSGTFCDGELKIMFEGGDDPKLPKVISDPIRLITTQSDFGFGKTEKFTFDVVPKNENKVKSFFINLPEFFCYDQWQPSWVELRNKIKPDQSNGRCEIGGKLWVSRSKGLVCPGTGGKGIHGKGSTFDPWIGKIG